MTPFSLQAPWRRAVLTILLSGAVVGCGGGSPSSGAEEVASATVPPGKETYDRFCVSCHAVGAAGAPRIGDTAAWAPKIATGLDAMVATVISGRGAMPPKGSCLSCTDAELKAAVEYMVAQSR